MTDAGIELVEKAGFRYIVADSEVKGSVVWNGNIMEASVPLTVLEEDAYFLKRVFADIILPKREEIIIWTCEEDMLEGVQKYLDKFAEIEVDDASIEMDGQEYVVSFYCGCCEGDTYGTLEEALNSLTVYHAYPPKTYFENVRRVNGSRIKNNYTDAQGWYDKYKEVKGV